MRIDPPFDIFVKMSKQLLGLLMLFFYMNAIAYHETCVLDKVDNDIHSGVTLVNIILDDLLDLPANNEQETSDFQYDEYRTANHANAILPILLIVFYLPRVLKTDTLRAPISKRINKIIPLQLGYYQYLFRLKPF
ncbi:hypothetical protein ACR79M_03735 [Sphingobacterium spiritivorum]|uniref:hypothetical protein n=2 Tax=Sphingobacterium TaxID=28453 RepID=UPI0028A85CD0|nr:hypothetical protein [Sphingobacterium sp.]